MKYIYAVKDLAVQAFGQPFTTRSPGEALRSFKDEVNRKGPEANIAAHPEDYELHHIGTYHEATGLIEPCEVELTARAKDLVETNGAN